MHPPRNASGARPVRLSSQRRDRAQAPLPWARAGPASPPTSPGVAARAAPSLPGSPAPAEAKCGRPPPFPPLSAAMRLTRSPALRPAPTRSSVSVTWIAPAPRVAEQHQHRVALALAEPVGDVAHLGAVVGGGIGDGDLHALHLAPLARDARRRRRRERLGQPGLEPLPLLEQLLDPPHQVLGLRLERLGHLRQPLLQLAHGAERAGARSPPRCAARRPRRRSGR